MSSSIKANWSTTLRNITFSLISLAAIVFLADLLISSTPPDKDDEFRSRFRKYYRIFAIPTSDRLEFAGEKVPLTMPDVNEKMEREMLVNTYWQSQTLLFIKRSSKWFPIIEPILKKEGVPEDLKYIALIESGLQNVVSPAGATGYWQFVRKTGQQYGLEINDEVDERYHVEKATVAACTYLKEAHERYGSWTLAAASYNMGMAGLDRQLTRQHVTNYYDLLLNAETSRYVFRIIAVKDILEHPKEYGFEFRDEDLYPTPQTRTVMIDSAVHDFANFALSNGITYKTLKQHNPWLRQAYLNNEKGKAYDIKIPKGKNLNQLIADPELIENYQNKDAEEAK